MSLVPVDPTNEASVVTLLERAAQWLSEAVHRGEPGEVALVKAQVHGAAEMAKQLNLSREIQLDAQEMVRRAEYALGKAIRRGQADGRITTRADGGWPAHLESGVTTIEKAKPTDYAKPHELTGQAGQNDGIYGISDGVEPDEFDRAVADARAEGNLTRANVVRKARKQAGPTTRDQRADLIEDLAAQGYSSRQMPKQVGVSEETVRQIARDYDIEIPADRSIAKTRRINSTDVVVNTATALEGLVMGVELIDYEAVDPEAASQWVDSLTESMRTLNRFVRQIKETTQ